MSDSPELLRLRIMYIYRILCEKTDADHGITMNGIIEQLADFGISAERKAVGADIEALRLMDSSIVSRTGRYADYRLTKREFGLAELKLLADAVNSSRMLTAEQKETILTKLRGFAGEHQAKELRRQLRIPKKQNTPDSEVFGTIDIIYKALAEKKQIRFKYFSYEMDKKKHYRDSERICSPYELVWNDEFYYLVAYYPNRGKVVNFRVDRMEDVRLMSEPCVPLPKGFDMEQYLGSIFSMFGGEETSVRLRFHSSLAGPVIDRFGRDISFIPDDAEHFHINVTVRSQSTFFGWLTQFGAKAEILTPEVRKAYADFLRSILAVNGDEG